MEEPLTNEVEISSYNVKAKLTIPAGTSYDKTNTVANTTGYISGLASINPLIQITPSSNPITITETISKQEFNMSYSSDWVGKIVEIDCDDRIVWLKSSEDDTDPVNISKYVDFNSDWFSLFEDFEFQTTGCVIRAVDYAERW